MEFFIARQPILDTDQGVYAYELLFRSGLENVFNLDARADGDQATSEVITNSVFFIGLEELTGGKRAAINFTRNLLLREVPSLLPSERMIVEILETVEPTPDIVDVCRKLKRQGYRIALDDVTEMDTTHPLLGLTDIIKVDFREVDPEYRRSLPAALDGFNLTFLAEKVETKEEYREALGAGYSLFQGYYFNKPELQSGSSIDSSKHSYLRILRAANKPEIEYDELVMIIKSDLGLTYKLLRFINSAYFGIKTEVRSIKQALVLLGFEEIKKWTSLLALHHLGEGKAPELLRQSILRARFCEEIGAESGLERERPKLFLLGMFTVLGALMNQPMTRILDQLPLDKEIRDALLGRNNKYRWILETVLAYERGQWDQFSTAMEYLDVNEAILPSLYQSAVSESDQLLNTGRL